MSPTGSSCVWRLARACDDPVPPQRSIVALVLYWARAGGGWYDMNTCSKCATKVGSLRCTWIRSRAAPVGPASLCEGVCALLMRWRSASPSVRRCGGGAGSRQRLTATLDHPVHLLVPGGPSAKCLRQAPHCHGMPQSGHPTAGRVFQGGLTHRCCGCRDRAGGYLTGAHRHGSHGVEPSSGCQEPPRIP